MGIETKRPWFQKSDGDIISLRQAYGIHWIENKEHSPKGSRTSLVKKIKNFSSGLTKGDLVLDLGSGRQILEHEFRQAYGKPNFSFVTLDYAEIKTKQLLDNKDAHVKADGNNLPFQDNTFMLIASNMAIDFMSPDAIKEMHRVLRENGRALINLCFSYLDPSTHETEYILGSNDIVTAREQPRFWGHWLQHNSLLIKSPQEIEPVFRNAGFNINNIKPNTDDHAHTTWWEVDATKQTKKPTVNFDQKKIYLGNEIFRP